MRVPSDAIFHEDGGTVYVVVNWRDRRGSPAVKAQLLRLAPRHAKLFRRYHDLGRSPKSIYYLIVREKAKAAAQRAARASPRPRGKAAATDRLEADDGMVAVPLAVLTKDQLVGIMGDTLGEPVPYLVALSLADLRHLHGRIARAMLR